MLICADIAPHAKTQRAQRWFPRSSHTQVQNRVMKKTGAATPDAYSFSFANKLTNIVAGATNATHRYFYDRAGNLVTSVVNNITNIYFYNAQNKLAQVLTYRMQLQQHECVHYLFAYDSLNRRVAITRSNTWSGQTTGEARRDLYDGTIPLAEADGNGNLMRYFVRGVGIAEGTGDMIAEVLWSGGSPDAVFYLSNHRGDTLAAYLTWSQTDYTAAKYRYDAFGNIRESATLYTPRFLFSTKEYLPAAGLYLYQYRVYDPIVGRWTQRDPIDYQDSINLYQFCGNNPVNLTDPDGRVVIVAVAGPLVVVGYAWLIYTKTAKPIDDQSLPNTYEGYTRLGVGRYKCGENPIMNAGGMAHEQQHMRDTFSLFSNAEKEQRAFRAQVSAIDAAIQKLKDEAKAAGRSLTPQEEAHIREAQEHRDFIKDNFLDINGAQRYDKEVNQRR